MAEKVTLHVFFDDNLDVSFGGVNSVDIMMYFVPEGDLLETARSLSELEFLFVVEADLDAPENQVLAQMIRADGFYCFGEGRILLPPPPKSEEA